VTPGAEYEFSLDVFDPDTSGRLKVYADFYDIYGFNVFGGSPLFSADSGEWQTIGWQGFIPSTATVGYVLVKFYCQPNLYSFNGEAEIWLDNVQFRESGGANLIMNGGFEEWMVGIGENETSKNSLIAYPNPATEYIHIVFKAGFETIVITDLMGREWMRKDIPDQSSCKLDISRLSEGVYILAVRNGTGHSGSRLFMVSRR
jgi:hypothetical protein